MRPPTYREHLERRARRYAHRGHVSLHGGDLVLALEWIELAIADLERIADLIVETAS